MCRHNHSNQHDTRDVDRCPHVLGIVKTFDLDLAYGERHKEGKGLQEQLVAIEKAKEDISICGVAEVKAILCYNT